MVVGVFAALMSAACYGIATVLQARAARATAGTANVDPRLLVRLAGQAPFLGGMLLDVIGFGAQFVALRWLPVFVVQAAQAASLAVTALVAVPILGARLGVWQWFAVASVSAGLAMLAGSAGAENAGAVHSEVHLMLLGLAVVLAVVGFAAGRLTGRARSPVLGLVAGLGFGVVALSARALTSLAPAQLIRDPASYALAAAGAVAFLLYATALQGGTVTATMAAVILGETLLPAVIGVALLGDHTRPGFALIAATGFTLVLAGALGLARSTPTHPQPA
jgi:drug/metabolite transporter (DMT)-like permease